MIDSLAIFHVLKSSKTPFVAVVTGTCSFSLGISFLLILATFCKMFRASSVFPLTRSHRTDSGMNLWKKNIGRESDKVVFNQCNLSMRVLKRITLTNPASRRSVSENLDRDREVCTHDLGQDSPIQTSCSVNKS